MNEPTPQEIQLRMQCALEQFCPKCLATLITRRAVMVELRPNAESRDVIRKVCCAPCYDAVVGRLLGQIASFMSIHAEVVDGRRLPASAHHPTSDPPPTPDPSGGAG